MINKNSIIQVLEIIKGKKIYNVDFENGTFECGASVFSFELSNSGLIKSNSVKFLYAINEFKMDNKKIILNSENQQKKLPEKEADVFFKD